MDKDTKHSKANEDKFKAKFKYYKLKNPKPSLQEVITADCNKVTRINLEHIQDDLCVSHLGLKSTKWDSYSIANHPGLILIRNPFTAAGQQYWIRRCLEHYPRKPNKTNIDNETEVLDWWKECHRDGQCNKVLMKKLRWTTLGYHHDWDTKQYSEANKSPFPEDLAELSAVVAERIGIDTFKAEAAIVNYYHMDSTLAPHTDHSECDLNAPLFSFSFGQSAIFLIGGHDKTTEPSAILLQSGDIVIMSREARLCYHAVPKILPATDKPWIDPLENNHDNDLKAIDECESTRNIVKNIAKIAKTDEKLPENVHSGTSQECSSNQCHTYPNKRLKCSNSDGDEIKINIDKTDCNWIPFERYVEGSRININVRQVLNDKQQCFPDL